MSQDSSLGPYHLLEEVGRGGMGVVYRARRTDLPQTLAIKILRSAGGRSAERFAREQEVLARLDHPAIVHFLDSGRTEEGDAFYVMELVDGLPIGEYCARHRLGIEARLGLFLEVCDAVSHAHRHLVAHRDLKPANILVDTEGRPRLLDFGIAKWLDQGEGRGQETTRGAAPMTLLYASPEQVRGEPVGVGTDVYSLSVLLFELLTHELPHGKALDLVELAIAIARQTAPPASEILRAQGDKAGAKALAGDLDAILAKGLAKDSAERYLSVDALTADLRRFLRHEPVAARRRRLGHGLRLFVRRHRLGVAAVGTFLLLLSATALLFAWQAKALAIEKDRAELARARAEARVDLLGKIFSEGDLLGSGPMATLTDALDTVRYDIEEDLAAGKPTSSALAATATEAYWRLGENAKAAALAETALRSTASISSSELGMLLAIVTVARPAPEARTWRTFEAEIAKLRQVANPQALTCESATEWEKALATLEARGLLRSLAVEMIFECALENRSSGEAETALRRIETLRDDLPTDHPARRDLDRLREKLGREKTQRADEVLP